MKTTHQVARELLALPDVPLLIEGWCQMEGHHLTAAITDYDPEVAIIYQQPLDGTPPIHERIKGLGWRWLNISPSP